MAAVNNQEGSHLEDAKVKISKKKISRTKKSDPPSNPVLNKSQKTDKSVNSTLAHDFNLDDLINLLLSKSHAPLEFAELVAKIAVEDKQSAIEIFQITIEKDFEISEKLKINRISEESAEAFSARFENLSFALKAHSKYENQKILKLIKDKCLC
jgi:hypothetical protein